MNKPFEAVNWNRQDNDYALMFWEQNLKQFWIDTEFIPSKDVDSWKLLPAEMKHAYMQALGGLTLLDTEQGTVGMPLITGAVESLQNKAVLSYMGMMENIHAKSYSTIFTTVATNEEIESIFDWVKNNKYLQYKAERIDSYYKNLSKYKALDTLDSKQALYQAMVASVCLESFLFYSGFFLPLWLAGQGQMVASSDIIKKIIEDESIHGVFIGLLAQDIRKELTLDAYNKEYTGQGTQIEDHYRGCVQDFAYNLIDLLMSNELKYTEEVYTTIGLTSEVKDYLKYNANKALMNLGLEPKYEHGPINPLVLNGLNTQTTQHDFFSKKSTNYEKATTVEHLTDADFDEVLGQVFSNH